MAPDYDKFLRHLTETGLLGTSCKMAGVARCTVDSRRKSDPDFAKAVETAMMLYRESIEHEVKRRAMDGVEEPVYYLGQVVGYTKRFSDQLLALHAKRHIPEYQDKSTVETKLSGGVGHHTLDMSQLSQESRDALRAVLDREKPEHTEDDSSD